MSHLERKGPYLIFGVWVCYLPEMSFKSDEKSGKVGRTFPDFDFFWVKG